MSVWAWPSANRRLPRSKNAASSNDAYLLTDEHDLMLEAIRARDADRAETLAHDHTRQFQQNFLAFLTENYTEALMLRPDA